MTLLFAVLPVLDFWLVVYLSKQFPFTAYFATPIRWWMRGKLHCIAESFTFTSAMSKRPNACQHENFSLLVFANHLHTFLSNLCSKLSQYSGITTVKYRYVFLFWLPFCRAATRYALLLPHSLGISNGLQYLSTTISHHIRPQPCVARQRRSIMVRTTTRPGYSHRSIHFLFRTWIVRNDPGLSQSFRCKRALH